MGVVKKHKSLKARSNAMIVEVIAFWSDERQDGMVCVREEDKILDSILAPKGNENQFLVWRKKQSLRYAERYSISLENIRLVK